MLVKQVSVFLENKLGRLSEVTDLLKQHDIDISAISLADTTNFGILRMIVSNPQDVAKIIKEGGFTVSITDVLALKVCDKPGGLADVLKILRDKNISVEYLYSFVKQTSGEALILVKVSDPQDAIETLKASNIKLLTEEEVYSL
ncbi:MAG: acetolactate synthase [Clostridia bacterium]|nr:acetolactate synthase [Clostridia bacterium]